MTEHLLKILIVGDGNVGKSSFVHRYVSGQFNRTYKMTEGDLMDHSNKPGAHTSQLYVAMLPNGGSNSKVQEWCALSDWAVPADSIEQFCKANGFMTWMETSVKDNKNIEEAMRRLVEEILSIQSSLDPLQPKTEDGVHQEQESQLSNSAGKSCEAC
ncbi:ras-related protein Rab-7L1-like [Anableps anableps]